MSTLQIQSLASESSIDGFTEKVLDELTYISYAHNRNLSPDVSPERWAKVYGPSARLMEVRYQAEREQMCEMEYAESSKGACDGGACGRTATVYSDDLELHMCARCAKESGL